MVAPAPHPAPTSPGATYRPADSADRLLALILPPNAAPARCALMRGPGSDRKYSDAPKGHRFGADDLRDHLEGRRTWAITLTDPEGRAVAGCRDYDGGGAALARQALAAAQEAGLSAAAIVIDDRSHVWLFYRRPAPAADIRHQLAAMLPAGAGETYPSGNAIRLPLGVHRHKGTRGILLTTEGDRVDLDTPGAVERAVWVLASLERNALPPPAPAGGSARTSGNVFGPYDPAAYENLPDGTALLASARYSGPTGLLVRRPQLRALAEGREVVTYRDGVPDTSDSAQLAVLVSNLLTTGRPATPGGPIVPGLGAPPESEIRAIALAWHDRLCPNEPLEHFKAHIDYEIRRYRPAGYAPEPTRQIGHKIVAFPPMAHDPPRPARGRPVGQRSDRAADVLRILAAHEGQQVKLGAVAAELGITDRHIRRLIADLGDRITTKRGRYGLHIVAVRSDIKSTEAPEPATSDPAEAVVQIGHCPPEPIAVQPVATLQSGDEGRNAWKNTRAGLPGLPAPAAGEAAAVAFDDLVMLIDEGRIAVRRGLDPETGEIGKPRIRAPRPLVWAWVQVQAPHITPAQFAAAWAKAADVFYVFGLWAKRQPSPTPLYTKLRSLTTAIGQAEEPSPPAWDALPPAEQERRLDQARVRTDSEPAALAYAQARHQERIKAHEKVVSARKMNAIRRDILVRELKARGLSETPPPRSIGKRSAAPRRADAVLAAEQQEAELWALLERRASEPTPATSRPRVTLAGQAGQPPRCVLTCPEPAPAPALPCGPADGAAGMIARLKSMRPVEVQP